MISLQQAKELEHGQMLYHSINRNADGSPQRWRVNGKIRLWKRDAGRIEVPVKHGLRHYGVITKTYLEYMSLTEEEALA